MLCSVRYRREWNEHRIFSGQVTWALFLWTPNFNFKLSCLKISSVYTYLLEKWKEFVSWRRKLKTPLVATSLFISFFFFKRKKKLKRYSLFSAFYIWWIFWNLKTDCKLHLHFPYVCIRFTRSRLSVKRVLTMRCIHSQICVLRALPGKFSRQARKKTYSAKLGEYEHALKGFWFCLVFYVLSFLSLKKFGKYFSGLKLFH